MAGVAGTDDAVDIVPLDPNVMMVCFGVVEVDRESDSGLVALSGVGGFEVEARSDADWIGFVG